MNDLKRPNISADAIEEDSKETTQVRETKIFDEKNYLDVKLGKGETSKELKIRILPADLETGSPFKTIHMHSIHLSPEVSSTEWKYYVCLEKTDDIDHEKYGNKCPFCELNREAYKKKVEAGKAGDVVEEERWKKISLENRASEVCVLRVIERGHEEDGPKFWKFNVRTDGKDPKNLIKELYKSRKQESIDVAMEENGGVLPEGFVPENILDLDNGKDLKVTISAVFDKDGKPTKKTSVSIVDYGKNKPLTSDDELRDKWVYDEKVWSDVFVVKPYEYLSIILDGESPFYDKDLKKWVSKIKKKDDDKKKNDELKKEADESIKSAEQKLKDEEERMRLEAKNKELEEDNSMEEELPF